MIPGTLNVFIVDDTAFVRDVIKLQIREIFEKPNIYEADNGLRAIEGLQEFKPDLIIMDVSMPVMGGIEATRKILEDHPEIKIIGFSMNDDERVSEEFIRLGAKCFMLKTASMGDFEENIRKVLGMD